jgi:RNA polymerase sigma-70 factor (ECF subfamily)
VSVSERAERFGALYRTRYRAIYAYVYRRLVSRESDVADVVAEVFVVAWRRLDDIPAGDEELFWLYGVAHRCVLRSQRSAWRRARLLGRLAQDTKVRTSGSASNSRSDLVRNAIERLRPRDREVLRLVMWEGLSHAEAGALLGCSVNAVAQRLRTARERLRSELAGSEPGASETTPLEVM